MKKNPFDPGYFTETELVHFGFRDVGTNVRIAKTCTIIGLSNISLGHNVRIDGYCSIIAAGSGYARIGSFVHIAGYCGIYAGYGVDIGDFAGLSAGVRVYTGTDDYSGQKLTGPTVPHKYTGVVGGAVELRRHVIIGAGTTVLPGITAGEGASVGAHSLVTKDMDSWTIYAGVPAKRLKSRSKNLLKLEDLLYAEITRI